MLPNQFQLVVQCKFPKSSHVALTHSNQCCLFSHKIKIPFSFSTKQLQQSYIADMAKLALSSLVLLSFLISGWALNGALAQKTWCVAKPSSDPGTLQNNINYACAQVDCKILQNGCPCSSPDNLINHASIAMNLYYQCHGRNAWNCHFSNSGLVTVTDPSYGACSYE